MARTPPIWDLLTDTVRKEILEQADINLDDFDLEFRIFSLDEQKEIRKIIRDEGFF